MIILIPLQNYSKYSKAIHNLLNFQETFLVDKLSNGANPKSRHCVVLAVASMEKRRKKKNKKTNNFQNLRNIYIIMQKGEQVFVGSLMHG